MTGEISGRQTGKILKLILGTGRTVDILLLYLNQLVRLETFFCQSEHLVYPCFYQLSLHTNAAVVFYPRDSRFRVSADIAMQFNDKTQTLFSVLPRVFCARAESGVLILSKLDSTIFESFLNLCIYFTVIYMAFPSYCLFL